MHRAAAWSDHEGKAARGEHARHLREGHPEIGVVLERLPGNAQVEARGRKLVPDERVARDDVDIGAGLEVEPAVTESRIIEETTIGILRVVALRTDLQHADLPIAPGQLARVNLEEYPCLGVRRKMHMRLRGVQASAQPRMAATESRA